MKKLLVYALISFVFLLHAKYAEEISISSAVDVPLVWAVFLDDIGNEPSILCVRHEPINFDELGVDANIVEGIVVKGTDVSFLFHRSEQDEIKSYKQRLIDEHWFPASFFSIGKAAVTNIYRVSHDTNMIPIDTRKALFPFLHKEFRIYQGIGPGTTLGFLYESHYSWWWNGSRLFQFDDDIILIGNDAQAYWITRKTEGIQIKQEYKDYALPMRIGGNPLLNTPRELPVPMASSCRIGNVIYIATNDGSLSSLILAQGQKPKWSQTVEKPFGKNELCKKPMAYQCGPYLFPIDDVLAGIIRTDEGKWKLYTFREGQTLKQEEDLSLPEDEYPLFIKDTFFLTFIPAGGDGLNVKGIKIMVYSIDGMKIERYLRFDDIFFPEWNIICQNQFKTILDAMIFDNRLYLLLSQNVHDNTELSVYIHNSKNNAHQEVEVP